MTDQHTDRGHMSDWLIGLTPYSDPLTGPVGPLLFRQYAVTKYSLLLVVFQISLPRCVYASLGTILLLSALPS